MTRNTQNNSSEIKSTRSKCRWGALGFGASLLLGCNPMNQPESSLDNEISNPVTTEQTETLWPDSRAEFTDSADIEAKIDELLAKMPLEQKVAQMIQPEIRDFTVEDMRRYGFGSFLNGGGSFPNQDKYATREAWVELADAMYYASLDATYDGVAIPTMWGTDAVHGHTNVIGATIFPHNIALGATRNPELVKQIAAATAKEVVATGINWVFAPTVAVARDDRWGRAYESYSEDPALVASYSSNFVEGMQGKLGENFMAADKTISTLKHFIGDGGTHLGDDQGDARVDEAHLWEIHGRGYHTGIQAGALTVMASFNSWQGDKLHGHHYLLTEVLKNKMGFDGLIVGDWNGHGQVPGCTNEHCPQSVNAGVDILMAPGKSWKPLLENTINDVKTGAISMSRIDDAVRRILRVKLRAGLFAEKSPKQRAELFDKETIGNSKHRELARQAVRESLVLLKNNGGLLPLKPGQRILVTGNAADDIARQSGGWTLTWQGTGNQNSDFPGATSIFQAIKDQVTAAGGVAELSETGDFEQKPDVAIVVFGEKPYAEGNGDLDNLEFERGNKASLALLNKLKAANIPVVSVFISGRPMWVNPELNRSDAFVAAWLPGSEGAGVADLLLTDANGNKQYEFIGRLPFSWPRLPGQGPLNAPYQNDLPLFEFGYGLTTDDNNELANFSEATGIDKHQPKRQTLFNRVVTDPFKLLLKTKHEQKEQTANTVSVSGLSFRTIDWQVQEDAIALSWDGSQIAGLSIESPFPEDFRRFDLEQLMLEFDLRVDQVGDTPLLVGANCRGACAHGFNLKSLIDEDTIGNWQHIAVPYRCVLQNKEQLSEMYSPFQLWSAGSWQIQLAHIRLRQGDEVGEFEGCIKGESE